MEISVIIADANGALLTGKAASTALKIRRVADGYLLDWNDLTFKASAWTTPTTPLVEVDATNVAGMYKKAITITSWADGFYQALVHFDDGTTVLNFEGEQYVQGGGEIEANFLAGIIEGSVTVQVALRRMLAALVGKADGGGTATQHYRDMADTVNRITATVDVDGNRTAVSFDDSGE
jgi:hypothetical protein